MVAIYKREMGAYFLSVIGYIVLAAFVCFSGIFFYATSLGADSASLTPVFVSMFLIILLIVPILTMKLFSEEKKQKTDQALLTAPVSLFKITMGKYLAACSMLAICFSIFIVYGLVITAYTMPEWNIIFCNMVALYLIGASLIAIGLFISALTESQVVAAVLGFVAGMFIYMLDSVASIIPVAAISTVVQELSFTYRLQRISLGLFSISDILFFVSIITIFIFLTIKVIEKKRWS